MAFISHVMFIISYISTMPLIIHVFYEQILNLEIFLNCEKKFYENLQILKFWNFLGIRYRVYDIGYAI
jgi:hypothetical protein